MIKNLLLDLRLRKRKGISKPVFIMAAIALAMLFVAVYFGAVSGWLGDSVNLFKTKSKDLKP